MSFAIEADVTLAQARDAEAFARLVDASKSAVASIALAILRDPRASEELAQEVYLEAWHGLGALRSPSSFLPWLRQLTRNRAHEHVRSRVRYRKRHVAFTSDALEVADTIANPGEALADAETHAALVDALERLPDETREIVTLFYREGESVRQVAGLLGLGEPAVKKRLERARTTLREAMLEHLADGARKTAPGAAFTAAVAAAIAVASPGAASAASAAGSVAVGGTGAGFGAKLAGSTGAASFVVPVFATALGAGAGVIGIVLGMTKLLRSAIDERERRELEALRAKASLAVIVAAGLMTCAGFLATISKLLTAIVYLGTFAGFQLALFSALIVELPRVLSRRPGGDGERGRRLWWMLFGSACGWTGVGLAVYFLLRARG